jgi:hypothetical protein
MPHGGGSLDVESLTELAGRFHKSEGLRKNARGGLSGTGDRRLSRK